MDVERRLERLELAIRGYHRWRLLGIATSGMLVVVVLVVVLYLGAAGPDRKGGELVLDKFVIGDLLFIHDPHGRARTVLETS